MYEGYIAYGWSKSLDKLVPRYVGIGLSNRHKHCLPGNLSHNRLVESHKTDPHWYVEVVKHFDSRDMVEQWEIETISTYGRLDTKTGTLFNHTDGGDGCVGKVMSDSQKAKISKRHKGKIVSEETKEKLRVANTGKVYLNRKPGKHSEETKKKIGKASSTRTHTSSAKQKIGNAQRGKIVSNETRKKQRNAKLGSTHITKNSYLTPLGTFRTLKEAATACNCSQQTIINRCNSNKELYSEYQFVKPINNKE